MKNRSKKLLWFHYPLKEPAAGIQGRYGYQETNVATMRRQSIAGGKSHSRNSSLEPTDSDLMRLIRTSRDKQIENEKLKRSRCLCLPRIYCRA